MSQTAELTLTINSVIDNLDDNGLSDGEPEINIFTADGTVTVSERGTRLSFSEKAEADVTTSTLYITDAGVKLVKRGAIESDMRFCEGACEETLYRVGPYAFNMKLTTKRIRNSLSLDGGELQLVYSRNVGGQEKNVIMKITAKRK